MTEKKSYAGIDYFTEPLWEGQNASLTRPSRRVKEGQAPYIRKKPYICLPTKGTIFTH